MNGAEPFAFRVPGAEPVASAPLWHLDLRVFPEMHRETLAASSRIKTNGPVRGACQPLNREVAQVEARGAVPGEDQRLRITAETGPVGGGTAMKSTGVGRGPS